jgi:hypothetical protein
MRPFTTEYNGRSVDLEMMQSILHPEGITPLELSFTSVSAKIITGIQKLAQRYTLLLLTQVGDVFFDAEQGTTFWEDMLLGAAQNAGQVNMAFNFASIDAVSQMQLEDADDTYGSIPNDERISSATLTDFNVDRMSGTLYLEVLLTSQAGETYTYVLPVTVVRS